MTRIHAEARGDTAHTRARSLSRPSPGPTSSSPDQSTSSQNSAAVALLDSHRRSARLALPQEARAALAAGPPPHLPGRDLLARHEPPRPFVAWAAAARRSARPSGRLLPWAEPPARRMRDSATLGRHLCVSHASKSSAGHSRPHHFYVWPLWIGELFDVVALRIVRLLGQRLVSRLHCGQEGLEPAEDCGVRRAQHQS